MEEEVVQGGSGDALPVDPESPLAAYDVAKPIGKGKFAIVYRATRRSDNEIVALKRISVDMMDEKQRAKCLKEVRLLQSLDHPNIIKYHDSFIYMNDLYIVFEWAAAGDLKRQLRKAQEKNMKFDERVIWKYFSQICEAMRHMHDRRIMHRDLKPANIFLTRDGTIKVGDLGLSRELSDKTLQAYSKVGTPLYMSPEVLRGDGYDFKSDVWSLGCLLYELAMLKSPFKSEGLNLYSLFQKISTADYQPLPENYSEQLRALASSMISTRPEDRPDLSYVCEVAQQMRQVTSDEFASTRARRAMELSRDENRAQKEPSTLNDLNVENKREEQLRPVISIEPRDNPEKLQQPLSGRKYPEENVSAVNAEVNSHPTPLKATAKATGIRDSPFLISPPKNSSNTGAQQTVNIRPEQTDGDDPLEGLMQPTFGVHNPPKSDADATTNATGADKDQGRTIICMDELFDKLLLLHYDSAAFNCRDASVPQISRTHFSLTSSTSVARNQFLDAVAVARWLWQRLGLSDANVVEQDYEGMSTVQVARQMLAIAHTLGLKPNDLSEVSPTVLAKGHGLAVCIYLNVLATKCLEGWTAGRPSYLEEENVDSNMNDEEVDNILEEANAEAEGDDPQLVFQLEPELSSSQDRAIIPATAPASIWKQEADRVAYKLRDAQKQQVSISLQEWAYHLSTMSAYLDLLGCRPNSNSDTNPVSGTLVVLKSVASETSEVSERMRAAELALNRRHTLQPIVEEFTSHQKSTLELGQRHIEASSQIADLSRRLQEAEDALEVMQERVKAQTSMDSSENAAVSIKQALAKIRGETRDLDICIGFTSDRLRQKKLEASAQRHKKHRKSVTNKNRGRGKINEEEEDLDLD